MLAISDSDSYLKWSVATLRALPADWQTTQVVVRNPVVPSAAQAQAATGLPVEVLTYPALVNMLEREQPDVVLLAATGPAIAGLTPAPVLRTPERPVLVTGLPGISVPAKSRGISYRAGCDLFVLHSHREVAEYTALAAEMGIPHTFGLATLPFLPSVRETVPTADPDGPLVFAAQAKVPVHREERDLILLALAQTGSGVVKLRARGTEGQTHHEPWPYPQLYAGLVQAGRVPADALHFATGSMSEALDGARGLVTVSSTAALEAMALGLPVLTLSDFGVSERMINVVFADSGCLGTLDDLAAGRLATADPAWISANYFHPATDNTWLAQLDDQLAARAAGTLPELPPVSGSRFMQARRRWRLTAPPAVWRRLQPVQRALRARGRRAPAPLPTHLAGSAPVGPPAGPLDGHQLSPPASPPDPSGPGR